MTKTAVITGATKGLGKALAIKFAQNGFELALCARNGNNLQQLKTELETLNTGAIVHTMACDVSVKAEVKAFAQWVLQKVKHVSVLINNAGVFFPGLVHNEEEGVLEKMIETNLYSAYHLTRALVPGMIEQKSGHIFNMCSVASIKAYPNGGSYGISKFALLGFSKSLREELKPHRIKVTSLIPGATYTPSWEASGLPESRFMKPEDIADMVWSIYNLSDNAVVEEILLRPMEGDI